MIRGRPAHLLAYGLLAAAVVAVYAPGLTGPFVFDDFNNITQNRHLAIQSLDPDTLRDAATSGGAGPLGRPLAMLTFALDYYRAGGYDPAAFKQTNLLIHVVNTGLVYLVALLLAGVAAGPGSTRSQPQPAGPYARYLPFAAAALWGLHPIQLTSVLYVVQRMTSLSALFVLAGLGLFIAGRSRLPSAPGRAWMMMIGGLAAGTLLGVASKENAALLPVFAFLVEVFFFTRAGLGPGARRGLASLYAATVFAPVAIGAAVIALRPEAITAVYAIREFTLIERLLTESRALVFYLGLIFFPYLRSFSLYHGDFATSTGLLSPATTAAAVLAWAAVVAAVVWTVRRRPLWGFAIAWFLVGHSIESSVIGLELVHEHRNYLPSFGIVLGAAWYALRGLDRAAATPRLWWPALAGGLAVLAFVTFSRAGIWGDGATLARFTARNHPGESRALGLLAASQMARGDDVRVIYRALRDAAAADETAIYPLVEMAKVVAGAERLRQRAPGIDGAGRAAGGSGGLLTAELTFDRAGLDRTRRGLRREIERRLRRYPVTGETTRALVELQMCARAQVDVCAPLLEAALGWHLIALENERTRDRNRAWIALSAAKLYAYRGEIPTAVDYTRRAMAFEPGNLAFPLQLVDLQIFLGNLDEADALLARVEGGAGLGVYWMRHVARLRRNLERARSVSSTPETGPVAARAAPEGVPR